MGPLERLLLSGRCTRVAAWTTTAQGRLTCTDLTEDAVVYREPRWTDPNTAPLKWVGTLIREG